MNENYASLGACHAIGALEADEARRLERAAQIDPELAAELSEQRRIAEALLDGFTEVAPAPSPAYWERVARLPMATDPAIGRRRSQQRSGFAPVRWLSDG